MSFDWLTFLQQHGIEYVERGANVAKGYVAVQCPWCGAADTSHHMGIPVTVSGPWGCWRNPEHRGRNPIRLVAKLAGISFSEAARLLGDPGAQPVAVDLGELKKRLEKKPDEHPEEVQLDADFFPLAGEWLATSKRRLLDYIRDRGFRDPVRLARSYDLHGAVVGEYAGRVIVPLYRGAKLYGWTGRSIHKSEEIRYKTFGNTRDLLWEPPRIEEGGKVLLVVEGPFDGLKVDALARSKGARAVALLGLTPSAGRLARLAALGARFGRVGLALDRGAEAQQLGLVGALAALRAAPLPLPGGAKDPGDLTEKGVQALVQAALTRCQPRV